MIKLVYNKREVSEETNLQKCRLATSTPSKYQTKAVEISNHNGTH